MCRTRFAIGSFCVGLCAILALARGAVGQEPRLAASAEQVGKYEKLAFSIHLDTTYQNPFDPAEVDLSLVIKTPSERRLTVPAFWRQRYQRRRTGKGNRQDDWFYPLGEPVWTARLAPMEVGTHLAVARLKDRRGTFESPVVRFQCTPSKRKGFLRTSTQDPRFFQFSEGEPFFAIGQNLAFVGNQQYADLSKAEEIFGRLSQNGANFLRIWTCCEDWATAIEARKSAWGRSWHWKPPIVPMPEGNRHDPRRKCLELSGDDGSRLAVSPSHPVALLPGTRYVVAGNVRTDGKVGVRLEISRAEPLVVAAPGTVSRWSEFRHEITAGSDQQWLGRMAFRLDGKGTAWLDDLSLREADGGPELLWEAEVNRPVRGFYNPIDCFVLDQLVEAAEENGIYLQLCFITRDLYMSSLEDEASPEYDEAIRDAKKLVRYAVARWGYSTSVAAWEYFNEMNPGLPTNRFYAELGEHLEAIDPYRHLRCTSAWGPSAKDCRHAQLDVAQVHFYVRPSDKQQGIDEVEAVLGRSEFLRQHAPRKPALVGEFGLATEKWGLSEDMKADAELVHLHNSLWASALSGLSGTVMFWWWDQLDRMDAYDHYRPLATFLADVPFAAAGLKETSATVSHSQVRLVGLQGRDCAYFWLFNSDAAWATKGVRGVEPGEIRDATIDIPDLTPGTYHVEWWDTYQGTIISESDLSNPAGTLRLSIPPFTKDVACKIQKIKGSGAYIGHFGESGQNHCMPRTKRIVSSVDVRLATTPGSNARQSR